jgi:hypothetical protein
LLLAPQFGYHEPVRVCVSCHERCTQAEELMAAIRSECAEGWLAIAWMLIEVGEREAGGGGECAHGLALFLHPLLNGRTRKDARTRIPRRSRARNRSLARAHRARRDARARRAPCRSRPRTFMNVPFMLNTENTELALIHHCRWQH